MPHNARPHIRFTRWSGMHEVSQSRKVAGPLRWVALPTRQGRGYCRLVAKHGAAGLGVWLALVELCAAQPQDARSVLVASWEDAAMMARLDPDEVERVGETLVEIGWVEYHPETASNGPATSTLPDHSQHATTTVHPQDRTGQETPPTPPRGGSARGASKRDQGPGPDDLASVWNENCGPLPAVRILNKARRRAAKSALTEEPDLKTWAAAIRKRAADPFWMERGFGFDTLIRPANRGKYLDEARAATHVRSRKEILIQEYGMTPAQADAHIEAETRSAS